MQDLQHRTGGICHDWIRHECNSMKTPSCCCWGIVTFFTAISNVSGNAFMMFGRESDQQPTHSQYSTTSQGRRENSSTTSPPGTIETMRNILDTIIPTQVCSFLVILFLHLYKIPRLEVNHFWQKHFSDVQHCRLQSQSQWNLLPSMLLFQLLIFSIPNGICLLKMT